MNFCRRDLALAQKSSGEAVDFPEKCAIISVLGGNRFFKEEKMRKYLVLFLVVTALVGCSTTQKGTGIGAATGALLGGVIGHQSGDMEEGAAIGAAVGGVGGYAVGREMRSKFCPVCGTHYDENVQFCPKDGSELIYKTR